jgi:hypothetical protein
MRRLGTNRPEGGQRIALSSLGVLLAAAGVVLSCCCTAGASGESVAVSLGQGHIGRYEWAADLEAPEDEGERERGDVCLGLSMLEPTSAHSAEGNEVAQCGQVTRSMPMIEGIRGGSGSRVRTVLAMVFGGDARRVHLRLQGQPVVNLRLRRASMSTLGSPSSGPLTYFVHGYAERVCIQALVAYDGDGEAIFRLPSRQCI